MNPQEVELTQQESNFITPSHSLIKKNLLVNSSQEPCQFCQSRRSEKNIEDKTCICYEEGLFYFYFIFKTIDF